MSKDKMPDFKKICQNLDRKNKPKLKKRRRLVVIKSGSSAPLEVSRGKFE